MSVDYSQGTPPPPPPKKGLGVLGWVAIGCGVILLICLVAAGSCFYMGKRALDKAGVSLEDVKSGKFKVDDGKGGKATVDFSGADKGGGLNVTTTDEKGQTSTVKFGAGGEANLPDWLPLYPGGAAQGTYDTTTPEGRSAAVVVKTSDSPDKVVAFYEERIKDAGLTVRKTTVSGGDTGTTMLTGTGTDDKRTASVTVTSTDEGTQATVIFTEKS